MNQSVLQNFYVHPDMKPRIPIPKTQSHSKSKRASSALSSHETRLLHGVRAVFALLLALVNSASNVVKGDEPAGPLIGSEEMQRIYDEAKTPFKYGVVIPPPPGLKVDCPTVFRHGHQWFMLYVQHEAEPQGYTTQLAVSEDMLHWKPIGTILPRGPANSWDEHNAAGGVALFDPIWGGSNVLQTHADRYWLSYLGGSKPGYETPPLSIGLAYTVDPSQPTTWQRRDAPILRSSDPDARPFETETLFKSYIFRDERRTLGAPFVMFYNARAPKDSERIGIAVSMNLTNWSRYGESHVLENPRPVGLKHGVISGDPQIVRMHGLWVMFYFGAFWKPGAFDTFAASRNLVHWTKWTGPDLIAPSESWDKTFAHKPWLLKHEGVVYHFYCAVGDQGRVIALATSKDLNTPRRPSRTTNPAEPSYKVAVCDWMILKRQKLGAFQLAKDIGADGVEVDMGSLGERETFDSQLTNAANCQVFLDKAGGLGLEISSLAMSGFYAQSFAERPTVPRMIQDTIDTMKRLNVKIAFLPLGVRSDLVKHPELRRDVIERLKAAGKAAEAAGVVIGIETALDAAAEVKLLDEIGSPAIKSYFNFANALKQGRDLSTELRTLGKDRICQIHVTNEDGVWLQNDPKINLAAIKRTLDEMGWRGWLVIERSRDARDARNVKLNFGANAAYVKGIFQ